MSVPEEESYSPVRRTQSPVSPSGTHPLPPWTAPAEFGLLLQGDLHEPMGCWLPGMFLRRPAFQTLVSYLFLYLGPLRLAWVGFKDNPEFSASALPEPGVTPCLWPHTFRRMVGGALPLQLFSLKSGLLQKGHRGFTSLALLYFSALISGRSEWSFSHN